eukprot:g3158.t1
MAERTFHEQIHSRGIRLMCHLLVIPRDLTPPTEVHDTFAFLIIILDANDSALKLNDRKKEESLASTISAILDPLLEMCKKSSADLEMGMYGATEDEQMKKLTCCESFMINCLEVITSALANREHIRPIWNGMKSKLQNHIDTLVSGIVESILRESGLTDIIKRMEEYDHQESHGTKMASDPALEISVVSESMLRFFTIVSDSDRVPEFTAIADIEVEEITMMTMLQRLTEPYEFVYNVVHDPAMVTEAIKKLSFIRLSIHRLI